MPLKIEIKLWAEDKDIDADIEIERLVDEAQQKIRSVLIEEKKKRERTETVPEKFEFSSEAAEQVCAIATLQEKIRQDKEDTASGVVAPKESSRVLVFTYREDEVFYYVITGRGLKKPLFSGPWPYPAPHT